MKSLRKALVVGGGIGGMCAAIELRKRGVEVDLVELDPAWQVYGAGITISGPTLRAFRAVGVLDRIMELGWCTDGCDIALANGTVVGQLPTPRIAGADVPGGGGIMRPVLARILSEATRASGTAVRLGVSFTRIDNAADAVDVTFTDGSRGTYDLVIGADGIHSRVRQAVFPDAPKPHFTGQGSWRAVVPRPGHIVRPTMFMGERQKAGVNPVSRDEMYLFFLDKRDSDAYVEPQEWPGILRRELAEFGGLVADIRDGITPQSRIVYRPLHAVLVPPPWHAGRVVLIGDAAHATTPHLASGAGIAVEDAVVLAQELERAEIEPALRAFVARRWERARLVVENSIQLGRIEQEGGAKEEHAQLMRTSMGALLAEI
ncbi:MAG: FAD-dependent oxidoreductase [Pigmentiphaga sp.]|uniref:FAD-dependent oxidoreductase n=1 Tax=Pigmentiphaga sp. TaxID=1977564 RepID=UPI003B54515D